MHAASFWGIAVPFLAIAAVNATEPPDAKPPATPKPAAASDTDDLFGGAPSRPRPAKPAANKAKQAVRNPAVIAARLDQVVYLYLPQPTPAERKIEEALKDPTTIEFVDTQFKDIVEYLKDLHHVEIQLDAAAMKDAGIDAEREVTKGLRGISLESALDILLGEMKLGWEVRHEVLWITTPKCIGEHYTTRLYPVDDLVPAGGKDGKSQDDYSTLIDLVTNAVAPGTWGGDGLRARAAGSIKGATLGGPKVMTFSAPNKLWLEAAPELGAAKVLSISATYHVHRELSEYLASIRRIHRTGGAADAKPAEKKPAEKKKPSEKRSDDSNPFG